MNEYNGTKVVYQNSNELCRDLDAGLLKFSRPSRACLRELGISPVKLSKFDKDKEESKEHAEIMFYSGFKPGTLTAIRINDKIQVDSTIKPENEKKCESLDSKVGQAREVEEDNETKFILLNTGESIELNKEKSSQVYTSRRSLF